MHDSPLSSEGQDSGTAWDVYEASWECDAYVILEEGGRMWQCCERLCDHPLSHRFWGTNYDIVWTDDGEWERVHKR